METPRPAAVSVAYERRTLLRAEALTKIYRSGVEDVIVLEDINLEIQKGELVALVGESGTGKTTLLHLLAALDTPTRGEVYFLREPVSQFRADQRAAYRNQRLGFVWQMHYLLPEFSALENTMMPQLIRGHSFSEARAYSLELLEEVGLSKQAGRRVGELSGGEQQRVALARALSNRPVLLLADEPTGNLDQHTAERVMTLLQRLHEAHELTSIIATHNVELSRRADRILRLSGGKIEPLSG